MHRVQKEILLCFCGCNDPPPHSSGKMSHSYQSDTICHENKCCLALFPHSWYSPHWIIILYYFQIFQKRTWRRSMYIKGRRKLFLDRAKLLVKLSAWTRKDLWGGKKQPWRLLDFSQHDNEKLHQQQQFIVHHKKWHFCKLCLRCAIESWQMRGHWMESRWHSLAHCLFSAHPGE